MVLCETVILRHRVTLRFTEFHRENGFSTGYQEMRPISSTLDFFSVVPCAASVFLCETVILRHRVAPRFTELHRENQIPFTRYALEFDMIDCTSQDITIREGMSGRFMNAPSRSSLLQNYSYSNTYAT